MDGIPWLFLVISVGSFFITLFYVYESYMYSKYKVGSGFSVAKAIAWLYLAIASFVRYEDTEVTTYFRLAIIVVIVTILIGKTGQLYSKKYVDIITDATLAASFKALNNKYYFFVENSPIGYYCIDFNGNIEFVNDTICNWFGYRKDEFIGKNVSFFLHKEDLALAFTKIHLREKDKDSRTVYSVRAFTKNGTEVRVKMTSFVSKNGHDTITGVMELVE